MVISDVQCTSSCFLSTFALLLSSEILAYLECLLIEEGSCSMFCKCGTYPDKSEGVFCLRESCCSQHTLMPRRKTTELSTLGSLRWMKSWKFETWFRAQVLFYSSQCGKGFFEHNRLRRESRASTDKCHFEVIISGFSALLNTSLSEKYPLKEERHYVFH